MTGGDPTELRAAARDGAGQAFLLDHRARVLAAACAEHRRRNGASHVDAAAATGELRRLGRRAATLDAWVLSVAASLDDADDDATLRRHLLTLGAGHPLLAQLPPVGAVDPGALPLAAMTDGELELAATWRGTSVTWRNRLHRERAMRWAGQLPDRLAAVPDDDLGGLLGWLASLLDDVVVDRTSLLTDLHVTQQEHRELLTAQTRNLERLLDRPDLTLLSFDPVSATPARGPALRLALGDVEQAAHVAVVLPGTSVALHAPGAALRDALALHASATRVADGPVATVLDLYDAPRDLGRAVDPETGRAAGRATGAFLVDLEGVLPAPARVTLVGHSYGAFTAARAAGAAPAHVDALVLLGAPGVGVAHVDDLGLRPDTAVWAARAPGDPIAVVADLDELVAALPEALRMRLGPLARPDAAFGPDPVDADFGARELPTAPRPRGTGTPVRGHVRYLAPGSASVAAVAAVVAGRTPGVRPARPPTRDRRASAGAG